MIQIAANHRYTDEYISNQLSRDDTIQCETDNKWFIGSIGGFQIKRKSLIEFIQPTPNSRLCVYIGSRSFHMSLMPNLVRFIDEASAVFMR